MDKTSVKERRAHQRHPASVPVQGAHQDGGVVARMVARNLSLGGLYCTSTTDFPEMTRLAVRLVLPLNGPAGEEGEPLEVNAVVVRREEVPSVNGRPRYDLALFFPHLELPARKQLERYLAARGA